MFDCKQCGKDHNLICENPEKKKWEVNDFCEKCMGFMDDIHENMLKEQREEDDN